MNARVTETAAEQTRDASPVELSVHRASAPSPAPADAPDIDDDVAVDRLLHKVRQWGRPALLEEKEEKDDHFSSERERTVDETRHTPGPWINEPGFYGSGAIAETIKPADPDRSHICIAHMDKVMWAKPGDPRVCEMQANAALVAAAPALLAACEAVLRHFDECAIGPDTPEILRFAIAEAKGGWT